MAVDGPRREGSELEPQQAHVIGSVFSLLPFFFLFPPQLVGVRSEMSSRCQAIDDGQVTTTSLPSFFFFLCHAGAMSERLDKDGARAAKEGQGVDQSVVSFPPSFFFFF